MNKHTNKAFSLVELLVVISIIGLLIAIALPSFNGAKEAAKKTATQGLISAISTGLEAYRAESSLGGGLPPSVSDATGASGGAPKGSIVSPMHTVNTPPKVRITGASLLVYALVGPDSEGTVGFKPDSGKTTWADSLGGWESGLLYDMKEETRPVPAPRYGPFGGAGLAESAIKLDDIRADKDEDHLTPAELEQRVFVDNFGMPILYYKARRSAHNMVYDPTNDDGVGIYDQRHNSLITGGEYGPEQTSNAGLLGIRKSKSTNDTHKLAVTLYDGKENYGRKFDSSGNELDRTFDNFIIDEKASKYDDNGKVLRARPVRAQEYLLISAGADKIYGTKDDVTNWN